MPPNQTTAPVATKKKAPILLQLAAVVLILPTAFGLFAVASQLLNGFDPTHAAVSILFLVILFGAFGLFSLKRWALYTVSAGEVIALAIMLLVGALSTIDAVPVVAIAVCWFYYKDFV